MSLFKFSGKDKANNICVRFMYIDGINQVFEPKLDLVDVTIDKVQNKLLLVSATHKKRSATLSLDKITDVRDVTETEITEADKSVIGHAVVGHLLLGSVGALIGGMSAANSKKSVATKHHFIIITFVSDNKSKQIVFDIVGASIGWKKFVAALPKDPNSPFALRTGPVEL